MNIENLITEGSLEEIGEAAKLLRNQGTPEAIEMLADFLLWKKDLSIFKHYVGEMICYYLVDLGSSGIEAMASRIQRTDSVSYASAILRSLLFVSQGMPPTAYSVPALNFDPQNFRINISSEQKRLAKDLLTDFVLNAPNDEDAFFYLMHFLNQTSMLALERRKDINFDMPSVIFGIISDATIKISLQLIKDFEELIRGDYNEEIYQTFLQLHPIFIDPLASIVIAKQSLGRELVTDFVIKRLDNEYITVEIEKPQDDIFTRGNNFTAKFTHAFGQVLDFHEWIDSHGEYARSLMPNIYTPKGVLVIGRRENLTPIQNAKLKRFIINSKSIEVYTFDDLLNKAKNLYANISRRK